LQNVFDGLALSTSVTDTQGNAYTMDSANANVAIFSSLNVVPLTVANSDVITVKFTIPTTTSNPSFVSVQVDEYDDIISAGALDMAQSASGGGIAPTSGLSAQLNAVNERMVGAVGSQGFHPNDEEGFTPESSWTQVGNGVKSAQPSGFDFYIWCIDKTQHLQTPVQASASIVHGGNYGAALATYRTVTSNRLIGTPVGIGGSGTTDGVTKTFVITAPSGAPVPAGATICVRAVYTGAARTLTVTDQVGNSYSQIASARDTSSTAFQIELWYAHNVAALNLGNLITIVLDTAAPICEVYADFIPGTVSASLDVFHTNHGGSSPASAGSMTATATANECIYNCVGLLGPSGTLALAQSGVFLPMSSRQAGSVGVFGQYQVASYISSFNPACTVTSGGTTAWVSIAAAFELNAQPFIEPPSARGSILAPLIYTNDSDNVNTMNAQIAEGTTTGDILTVGFFSTQIGMTLAVADSAGNTYNADVQETTNGTLVLFTSYNSVSIAPGGCIALSGATQVGNQTPANLAAAVEIAHIAASPLDQSLAATGTGSSPTTGNTSTTSQNSEVVLGAIGGSRSSITLNPEFIVLDPSFIELYNNSHPVFAAPRRIRPTPVIRLSLVIGFKNVYTAGVYAASGTIT